MELKEFPCLVGWSVRFLCEICAVNENEGWMDKRLGLTFWISHSMDQRGDHSSFKENCENCARGDRFSFGFSNITDFE